MTSLLEKKLPSFIWLLPKPVTQFVCIVQFCQKDDEQMLPFDVTTDQMKINQLF